MRVITRRSLLIIGTGAIASLAGCGGNGDEPEATETTPEPTTEEPTETTREQPTSLEIENPVLCAERPMGYQQYSAQPDETYGPNDTVWLYFEPSTVGTESAGEDQVRFEYEFTWSVTGPDGENLGTMNDSVSKTVAKSADLSGVFLSVEYPPSPEFDAGTHTLELEVIDTIAGTSATESVEFEVESDLQYTSGEFGIGKFVFTKSEAPGYDDYTKQPDAEYGPADTVWYYYEIDGFAFQETSNAKTPDLQITETVTGPEGDIWSQADIPLSNMFDPSIDLDTYFITDHLSPSEEWLPGEYEIRLVVTDGYTDESVTETYTFTVVE